MDVPASISVLTGKQLEELHATRISDWAGYVPGLNVLGGSTPGNGSLILEGIAPIGAASEVGIYVNDTPIGSSSSFGAAATVDLMPYELDHIEVLRGPQGTLYGASTMGGLVKYVLKSPDVEKFSANVGGDLSGVKGSDGHGGGFRGGINAPLIEGRLGLRASVYDQYTPGYIDNGLTGARDQNGIRQSGGRAALRWDINPDVSVQASGLYEKVAAPNETLVALSQTSGQPLYGDLTNNNLRGEPFEQQLRLYDLTLNWDLHWAELTSVSSYQSFQNNSAADLSAYLLPFGPIFGLPTLQADVKAVVGLEKFTQEIRLASPQDQTLQWLVGAFYTHERSGNDQTINIYDGSGALITPLAPFEMTGLSSIYKEYAAFGDLTYQITDRFDVTGGLRYAHNSQSFVETLGGVGAGGPQPDKPGNSSEGVPTFMVSPKYHLNDATILYARVASGYQPGGPNVVFPSFPAPSQFSSSKLIDFQPGLKSTFFDAHASVDVSAFYIDWTKIQVLVANPSGPGSAIENGGKARSEGLDFNGTYSPAQGMVLGANLNYTDAKLTSPVASFNTLRGARLPYIPRWSGTVTAEYTRAVPANWRAFAGGGVRYVADRLSAPDGETIAAKPVGYSVGSYSVIDLHFGASHRGLTIALFAKNLTDKRAYLTPAVYANNIVSSPLDIKAPILQPRTIGISVDVTF